LLLSWSHDAHLSQIYDAIIAKYQHEVNS